VRARLAFDDGVRGLGGPRARRARVVPVPQPAGHAGVHRGFRVLLARLGARRAARRRRGRQPAVPRRGGVPDRAVAHLAALLRGVQLQDVPGAAVEPHRRDVVLDGFVFLARHALGARAGERRRDSPRAACRRRRRGVHGDAADFKRTGVFGFPACCRVPAGVLLRGDVGDPRAPRRARAAPPPWQPASWQSPRSPLLLRRARHPWP